MPHVADLEDLMVADPRLHKGGADMDHQPQTCKAASPFQPTAEMGRQCDPFLRDPQYGFLGLDHQAVFLIGTADLAVIGVLIHVEGSVLPIEDAETVPEAKIDRSGPYILRFERLDPDLSVLKGFEDLMVG